MSSQSEISPVQVHEYLGNQGGGMDSQGDEFEDEDDFDGIEDISPSQAILPSVKRSCTEAGKNGSTLADLFSDDEMEEPLAMLSAMKQTNQRSQRKF